MPAPDKARTSYATPLVCGDEECDFTATMEWQARRHEFDTGHRMVWPVTPMWSADGEDRPDE